MKMIWLSKAPLPEPKLRGLLGLVGCPAESAEVYSVDLRWLSTESAGADISANVLRWRRLAEEFDVIAGEFPVVAFEALDALREYEGPMGRFDVWVPADSRWVLL